MNDGQISEQKLKIILEELDKYMYNDLKEKTHSRQSGLGEQEKRLIEEEKAQALCAILKR